MDSVQKVVERLLRSTSALETSNLPYSVIGGNAVAAWVRRVDPAAVRFTKDVDLMVRREDFPAVTAALTASGFVYAEVVGVHVFVDGPEGSVRDAVHVLFSDEKVRPDYTQSAPSLAEVEYDPEGRYRVLSLEALVRMKLTSFRRKDQVHVQDMIGVGLIDRTWLTRLPVDLASRLQELLDDPEG